jgi:hypothetical protein
MDWQEGYLAVRQISEDRYLAVMPLIYGARLVVCDETGHFDGW